eukprot:352800-Chlamydomonas_euryale.AAC.5
MTAACSILYANMKFSTRLPCPPSLPASATPHQRGRAHTNARYFLYAKFETAHVSAVCAGRLVIELFDDVIPTAAAHFRNRCMPGSHIGIAGLSVNKLVPFYAVFLGKK